MLGVFGGNCNKAYILGSVWGETARSWLLLATIKPMHMQCLC